MSTDAPHHDRALRFDLREGAGSLGDMGTFLPLTVALAATTGLHLGWMLVAAGLMNILSGYLFRMPIPVQPMKAIAAVAIADGLSGGAVVAAGWIMGGVVTVLAVTGLMPWIDRLVPRPVVRAIQLGIGIKLLITGLSWAGDLPILGIDSMLVVLLIGIALLLGVLRGWPLVLPIFLVGFIILAIDHSQAYRGLGISMPELRWLRPTRDDWINGSLHGALPQLPLTLLNSVIAVCALTGDYFPKRAITPRQMSLSVGLMNLLCIGWSGLPLCHGSGGLAAQYRAGARTGGSVIMLGLGKVVLGLAFGASLLPLLKAYPLSILAPLIGLAGGSLAHAGYHATRRQDWLIVLPAAAVIALTHTLYGLALGIALYLLISRAIGRKESPQ